MSHWTLLIPPIFAKFNCALTHAPVIIRHKNQHAGADVSGLFAIIFLAAVVGVFKPYIGNLKRWHFAVAALVALILVGSFADPKAGTQTAVSEPAASTADPVAKEDDAAPGLPPSKWTYVNRRPKGTHYRRAKGYHLAVWRWVDAWRAFRAGAGVGRAEPDRRRRQREVGFPCGLSCGS